MSKALEGQQAIERFWRFSLSDIRNLVPTHEGIRIHH